jgi:hypothetical protein
MRSHVAVGHSRVGRTIGPTAGVVWLLWWVLLPASCSDSPTMPSTDSIDVRSAEPAAGTMLAAGSQVTFTYRVTCNLVSSNNATAGLAFIHQIGDIIEIPPSGLSAFVSVGRGTTTVTLTDTVTIRPGTRRLDVLVALVIQDRAGQQDTVVSYPVQ